MEFVGLGHFGQRAGEVDEGVAAVGGGKEEDVDASLSLRLSGGGGGSGATCMEMGS